MLEVKFTGGLTEREFKSLAISPAELAADFAHIAREDRDYYKDENSHALGAATQVIDITDRQRGAPPEAVRMPGGIYVAEYVLWAGVVRRALDILLEVSPKKTGRYSRSHHAYVNGREVSEYSDIGAPDQVVIASKLVYSRRLEAQWGSPRVSPKTPQGPYWVTASRINREFGGAFRASFTFWGTESKGRKVRGSGDIGKYPVIIIRPAG